jgi:hypothetical protein
VELMEVIAVAAGVLLLIGFISGYAVREFISRLHRAKAGRQYYERMMEELARTQARKLIAAQPADRRATGFQSGDGAQPPREGGASR